jgi:hypothetical protein
MLGGGHVVAFPRSRKKKYIGATESGCFVEGRGRFTPWLLRLMSVVLCMHGMRETAQAGDLV